MDIIELGAIGELVGGVAVIASLLFVGQQVRQSNRLERAESQRTVTRDYVATMLQVDSPLLRRAVLDFEGLSKDDQLRIHNWLIAFFTVAQTEVSLSNQNLAETGDYPPVVAAMTRSPGLGYWWRTVSPTFNEGFRRYMRVAAQEAQSAPAIHELMPWLSPDTTARGGAYSWTSPNWPTLETSSAASEAWWAPSPCSSP